MNFLQSFLNPITMYRLLLLGLLALAFYSFFLTALGILSFSLLWMFFGLLLLFLGAWTSNQLLARYFAVPVNVESAAITALILFFVVNPAKTANELLPFLAIAVMAMLSKYLLAWRRKHIFNPAAVALFIFSLLRWIFVSWWVATPWLLAPVLILGFLLVQKIRRFPMFLTFLGTATVLLLARNLSLPLQPGDFWEALQELLLSWPLFFFASFMLTEPLSTPATKKLQVFYGLLIAVFFAGDWRWGPIFPTPELALLLGNLLSFLFSMKQNLRLPLLRRKTLAKDLYEFVFQLPEPLKFRAGQYLEWTLPQEKFDDRGNRRYFTIASAPGSRELSFIIKVNFPASAFKQKLLEMKKSEMIVAGQLAGDFVLPKERKQAVVWIAGGVGITPFVSMTRELLLEKKQRQIDFFYSNRDAADFILLDLWQKARRFGLRFHPFVTGKGKIPQSLSAKRGYLTEKILRQALPAMQESLFYLSGPNAMVESYKKLLLSAGIPDRQIVTDYFPGF